LVKNLIAPESKQKVLNFRKIHTPRFLGCYIASARRPRGILPGKKALRRGEQRSAPRCEAARRPGRCQKLCAPSLRRRCKKPRTLSRTVIVSELRPQEASPGRKNRPLPALLPGEAARIPGEDARRPGRCRKLCAPSLRRRCKKTRTRLAFRDFKNRDRLEKRQLITQFARNQDQWRLRRKQTVEHHCTGASPLTPSTPRTQEGVPLTTPSRMRRLRRSGGAAVWIFCAWC
jgi:hypothetical protein